MDPVKEFEELRARAISGLGKDEDLVRESRAWMLKTSKHRYTYNFTWMGRPVIQFPQDLMALQELIFATKPEVIVETGVAHGGTSVFFASMLQLLGGDGFVVAVDIDVRAHNRAAIESHPMGSRIRLVEGSSIAPDVVARVKQLVGDAKRVMVVLDSDHTDHHVTEELKAYAGLVRKGMPLVVYDTSIEDAPDEMFPHGRWGKGNSPKTAVRKFLSENDRFEIDHETEDKLLITVGPEGYLRCLRDP